MINAFWSLDQCVFDTYDRAPNKSFLVDTRHNKTYSYKDAVCLISSLVEQIERIQETEIALWLDTSFEGVCLFYALIRSGKNPVLIDPLWGKNGISNIFKKIQLKLIVSHSNEIDNEGIKDSGVYDLDFSYNVNKALDFSARRVQPGNIIIFTSGTTSGPKGIMLTQENMRAAYLIGKEALELDEHVVSGSFYRISGLGILGINFLFPHFLGGTSVLMPEYCYIDQEQLQSTIEREGVNFMYIVPPIVQFMVSNYELKSQRFNDQLLCVSGSARLDTEAQEKFQKSFAPLANIYGLSECGFAFLFGDINSETGLYNNSVGFPKGLTAKIVSESGEIITDENERGILHVKTPSCANQYINDEKMSSAVFYDGWLITNDIAYYDSKGRIYVIGRNDDVINKSGNIFHLAEAEELLNSLDDVTESKAIKVDCALNGEDYILVAYVDKKDKKDSILESLRRGLGESRSPSKLFTVDKALPRNGAGKYSTIKIKELVGL